MRFKVIGFLLTVLLGACAPAARPAAPAVPVVQKEIVYVVVTATPEAIETPVPATPAPGRLVDGCSEKLRVKRCVQNGGKQLLIKVSAGGDANRTMEEMEWMMRTVDPEAKEFADPKNFMNVFMAGGINLGAVKGAVSTNKSAVGNWSCWMDSSFTDASQSFWCETK